MSKIINLALRSLSVTILVFFLLLTPFNSLATANTITNVDSGAEIFKAHCAGCHINGGNIIRRGKNLKLKALRKNKADTQEAIALLVANGKNNMSAYGDKLSSQEIVDVSAYVLQRAKQNWK